MTLDRTVQRIRADEPDARALHRRLLWVRPEVALWDAHWDRSIHAASRTGRSSVPCFVLMRSGTYVKSVGQESALGGVNQVTLYDCDLDVAVMHPRGDHTAGTTFLLDPEFLASLVSGVAGLEVTDARAPFRRLAAPVSPRTHLIYRALVGVLTDEPHPDPLVVDDTLFALVRRVLRELPAARPSRRRAPARLRRRLPEMQAYVEARAHRAVSLAELGRFFGCSPEYVSRIFAEEVGIPLSRYVVRLRMHRAVERILDGAASLADVALETGFASHSHLCTAMRREMGLAPGQLRAKHRAAAPQNPQFRE